MKITVKLFATLRENREKIFELNTLEKATPSDVAAILAISEKDIAIIMVNGRGVEAQHVLKDGDVLALFPPVGGG